MHIKCKYRRAVCTHTWCFSCLYSQCPIARLFDGAMDQLENWMENWAVGVHNIGQSYAILDNEDPIELTISMALRRFVCPTMQY